MRKYILAVMAVMPAGFSGGIHAADKYGDFGGMAAENPEGIAYSVISENRGAPVTVFAPHGGLLEPGTDLIARECAGDSWNFYAFIALDSATARSLHVTAAHYDEPRALALARTSVIGLAMHDQRETGDVICLGGGNAGLRAETAEELKAAGFSVEAPCGRLPGVSPDNIVNRAEKQGLQFEFSAGISKELETNSRERARFCSVLRQTVTRYLRRFSMGFRPPRATARQRRHY
ncbi:MAG: poly-gamma-glutamate hydrolase family protein [Elusimicrobiaceae bacterium]|nr:poly-gamma-glutamate hydrolase family protein [Elusimicrobiaceae bacterium]